jgi:GGDEF domain-containing protein
VARLGGDEFAILLEAVSTTLACLRKHVDALETPRKGASSPHPRGVF